MSCEPRTNSSSLSFLPHSFPPLFSLSPLSMAAPLSSPSMSSQGSFLTDLTRMFEATTQSGSVSLVMKRSSLQPIPKGGAKAQKESKAAALAEKAGGAVCLLRASVSASKNRRRKAKSSTVVSSSEHVKFQKDFNTLLRAHMSQLKRKTKDKKEKKNKKNKTTKAAAPAR